MERIKAKSPVTTLTVGASMLSVWAAVAPEPKWAFVAPAIILVFAVAFWAHLARGSRTLIGRKIRGAK